MNENNLGGFSQLRKSDSSVERLQYKLFRQKGNNKKYLFKIFVEQKSDNPYIGKQTKRSQTKQSRIK